jgi:hypothetical protein
VRLSAACCRILSPAERYLGSLAPEPRYPLPQKAYDIPYEPTAVLFLREQDRGNYLGYGFGTTTP